MMGGPTPVTYGRDCDAQNPDKGKCTQAITYNKATGIAVDARGNAYLTGYTVSVDFPTTSGALQRTYRHTLPYMDGSIPSTTSSPGAFVVKLNPTASAMIYSTLLGNGSQAEAIAVDATGQAVVTGYTHDDVPLKNAVQAERRGGNDAFVTKLNATGTGLIYSTYLGSESDDRGRGVAVDQDGYAYIIGDTYNGGGLGSKLRGLRFPTTPGAFRTSEGDEEGMYVAKFDLAGNIQYSTLIGGGYMTGQGIAVDSFGCAYITGFTFNAGYPVTAGAYQPKPADVCAGSCFTDSVISKLSADGGSLIYSTYLGSSKVDDIASDIAVDANDNAYVAVRQAYPDASGVIVSDTQIVKFNAEGNGAIYSYILPGGLPSGLALDANGNVYVTGAGTEAGQLCFAVVSWR